LAGLVIEYFRHAPLVVVAASGLAMLLLVNMIFLVVSLRSKKK
jgi:hypothetical protein